MTVEINFELELFTPEELAQIEKRAEEIEKELQAEKQFSQWKWDLEALIQHACPFQSEEGWHAVSKEREFIKRQNWPDELKQMAYERIDAILS